MFDHPSTDDQGTKYTSSESLRHKKCDLSTLFEDNMENRQKPPSSPELIKATEGALSHVWSEAAACCWGQNNGYSRPFPEKPPTLPSGSLRKHSREPNIMLPIQYISHPYHVFMHWDCPLPYTV